MTTYAIDWASIAIAPYGSDAGTLVASGLSWRPEEAATVLDNEKQFFDAYMTGLADRGWTGSIDAVRLAYLGAVCGYIPSFLSVAQSVSAGTGPFISFVRERFGGEDQEIAEQVNVRLISLFSLLDEATALADRLKKTS